MFLAPASFVFFEMMLFYCLRIRRLLPILPGPNRYLTPTSQAAKTASLSLLSSRRLLSRMFMLIGRNLTLLHACRTFLHEKYFYGCKNQFQVLFQ